MPTPPQGYPEIYHPDPDFPCLYMWDKQAKNWKGREDERCAVLINGTDALAGQRDDKPPPLPGFVREHLQRFLCDEEVKVGIPIPADPDDKSAPSPIAMMVFNISKEKVDALLRQKCISMEKITFHFLPLSSAMPNYVGSLRGYNPKEGENVRKLIADGLRDGDIQTSIKDLAIQQGMSEDHAAEFAQRVPGTVDAKELKFKGTGSLDQPFYIITAECPATTKEGLRDWRNIIASVNLTHFDAGQGTWGHPGKCAGCHSGTHPTGLCDFPHLPGWLGPNLAPAYQPPAETPTAAVETHLPQAPKAANRLGQAGGTRPKQQHGPPKNQGKKPNARLARQDSGSSSSSRNPNKRLKANPSYRAFDINQVQLPNIEE